MNPFSSTTTSSVDDGRTPPGESEPRTTEELVLVVGARWHQLHRRHKALTGRLLTISGSASAELADAVRQLADAYGQTGRALDAARPGVTTEVAQLAIKLRDALTAADGALDASRQLAIE